MTDLPPMVDRVLLDLATEHDAIRFELADIETSFERANAIHDRSFEILASAGQLAAATLDGVRSKLTILAGSDVLALRDLDAVSKLETRLAWSVGRDLREIERSG